MQLFLMRHGPAEDISSTGLDSDRALTPQGRERVRLVARELRRMNEVPALVVTSPLLRALETARIVQSAMGLEHAPFEEHAWLGMQGRARELVDQLLAAARDRAVLVGHEPELSSLVHELTGNHIQMEKAMVAAISFEKKSPKLKFVLEPKSLSLRKI